MGNVWNGTVDGNKEQSSMKQLGIYQEIFKKKKQRMKNDDIKSCIIQN